MIAFLLALVPFLPSILGLVGWAVKTFGASEKQLKEFQELVERANKEGLLSVEARDRLLDHKRIVEERIKAKK